MVSIAYPVMGIAGKEMISVDRARVKLVEPMNNPALSINRSYYKVPFGEKAVTSAGLAIAHYFLLQHLP
jgi:hypothetical protein